MKPRNSFVIMLIALSLALQGCGKDEKEKEKDDDKPPTTAFVVTISGAISHTDHTVGQSGTVTFSRFPFSVAEFKQAREQIGGEPHGAAALQIMASEMWRRNNQRGRECVDLNNTNANVTSTVNRLTDVYRPSTQRPYQMAAYLKGASWENGYNPDKTLYR
jgi:D-methionine transport system substrate-binding protein